MCILELEARQCSTQPLMKIYDLGSINKIKIAFLLLFIFYDVYSQMCSFVDMGAETIYKLFIWILACTNLVGGLEQWNFPPNMSTLKIHFHNNVSLYRLWDERI